MKNSVQMPRLGVSTALHQPPERRTIGQGDHHCARRVRCAADASGEWWEHYRYVVRWSERPPVTRWVKPAKNGNQWLYHCSQIGKEQHKVHTIYTYGYQGTAPETLRALADELGGCVVDIRYVPWSRDPRWQPASLSVLFGTRYCPVHALGNVNYKNGGPIKLANPVEGVAQLRPMLEHVSVILLCVCRNVEPCHRTIAAEYLSEQLGAPVVHLDAKRAGKGVIVCSTA